MALNRQQSEKTLISSFITNGENTMNTVVTNSVGTALLLLRDKYIDGSAQNELDNFCQRMIKELEEHAITIENAAYKSAIDFIIRKAAEDIDPTRDVVTLYHRTETKGFQEERYVFPIKEVLSLVWTAIHDNNAYLHHYEGTRNQRVELAQADLAKRLEDFYVCLSRMQRETVCHHGNRNELVFLLNDTHEDIHILEDDTLTIILYYKEKIRDKVLEVMSSLPTNSDKRKLFANAFIEWMSESRARRVLLQVDPKNIIKNGLFDLFIQHGVSPAVVLKKADEVLDYLEFHCDPQVYPVLSNLSELLKEVQDDKQAERSKALLSMQHWFKNDYQFIAEQDHRIIHFHRAYFTHKNLQKYKDALVLTGKMTPEQYDASLYFLMTCLDKFVSNPALNALSSEEVANLDHLQSIIRAVESDSLYDVIENFFVHWYSPEITKVARNHLYAILLNEFTAKKILFTDNELAHFLSTVSADGELLITPYLINRVFLSAILVSPERWSNEFARLFKLTFQFVVNVFDQNTVDSHHLKRDSYPEMLLAQLNFLKNQHEQVTPNSRPDSMIIMPEQAKHASEWVKILRRIPEDKREDIIQRYFISIERTLLLYIRNLKKYLTVIHGTQQAYLIRKFFNLNKNVYFSYDEILECLKLVDSINQLIVIEMLKEIIILYINYSNDVSLAFIHFMNGVTSSNARDYMISIFEKSFEHFTFTDNSFSRFIDIIPFNKRIEYLRQFPKNTIQLCSTLDLFMRIISQLPEKHRIDLIDILDDKIKDLLDYAFQLVCCLSMLPPSDQHALLIRLPDKIASGHMGLEWALRSIDESVHLLFINKISALILYQMSHQPLEDFLNAIDEKYWPLFVGLLDDNELSRLFDNNIAYSSLSFFLDKLDINKRHYFITALGRKINNIIMSPKDLGMCLDTLPCQQWPMLISNLDTKFIDMIFSDSTHFLAFLEHVTLEYELDRTLGNTIRFSFALEVMYKLIKAKFVADCSLEYHGVINELFSDDVFFSYLKKDFFHAIESRIDKLSKEGEDGVKKAGLLTIEYSNMQRIVFDSILKEVSLAKNESSSPINTERLKTNIYSGLMKKVKALAQEDFIHHERNPFAAFFKKLLGILVAIPLIGIPFFGKGYHRFFFESRSARMMHDIKHDLKRQRIV